MILWVLLGVCVVCGLIVFHTESDAWGMPALGVGLVSVFVLVLGLLVIVINYAGVSADMARITELRRIVAIADPRTAHDIYGQASTTNQDIVAARKWRQVWWARDFTPAQWDTVRLIDLGGHVMPSIDYE